MSEWETACRHRYVVGGISVPVSADANEICKEASDRMKRKGLDPRTLHFRLYKRSVDARRRNDVRFVCSVLVGSDRPIPPHVAERAGLRELREERPAPRHGSEPIGARPLVVGMGPAGMFAALLLAENGYRPILIDRGESVADRVETVRRFREEGILESESNVQFGAGGAGTFSDGKLVTRIHDPLCGYVLETFARFGAPEEILTLAKPHIGTDILQKVVAAILDRIAALGGTVLYRCRMDGFDRMADGTLTVHTTKGDLSCGAVILAVGHSARDTYRMLIEGQFAVEAKPISVGVRAEHLQSDVDSALYGSFAGHPNLGHAEYAFSDTTRERGVYTFCMCPGGEVVAAASEEGGLVVNGMSDHARSGRNANAAVAVSLSVRDYEPVNGSAALGAIELQRRIERAAFRVGGGDYFAPVMTLGDLLNGTRGTEPARVQPSYRGGRVRVCDLTQIFPDYVTDYLRFAFRSFGKKMAGFDAPDAVLTAAETRTSAPLRILRDAGTLTAVGQDRIYPCGEGAGYAGGITSAAVDGLRAAIALINRFGGPET